MRKYVVIGLVLLVVFGVTYYVLYVPPRKTGYLGLMYSWLGPQTNAGGEVVYVVGVSNGGSFIVRPYAGKETAKGVFLFGDLTTAEAIVPGETTSVIVNAGRDPDAWRVAVYAHKV